VFSPVFKGQELCLLCREFATKRLENELEVAVLGARAAIDSVVMIGFSLADSFRQKKKLSICFHH
jgi:hypothetical protein